MNNKKCTDCSYSTSNQGNLKVHRKRIHDKVKDKKCGKCRYSTPSTSHLATHKNATKHIKKKRNHKIREHTQKTHGKSMFSVKIHRNPMGNTCFRSKYKENKTCIPAS